MAYIVRMPKLEQGMNTGVVLEWLVEEGDAVGVDDPLLDVESEKTAAEVEAQESGVLRSRYLDEGARIEPGTPLGIVADPDEDVSDLEAEAEADLRTIPGADVRDPGTADASADDAAGGVSTGAGDDGTGATGGDDEPRRVSPRARRRADDLGMELAAVEGTGPGGAITEDDVEKAAANVDAAGGTTGSTVERTTVEERELTEHRRTIADRLGESHREAVHVTLHRWAGAEAALDAVEAADEDVDPSLVDCVLVAVSEGLSAHPSFNATFEDGVHRIHEEHAVGLAVDAEGGLVTPVLPDLRETTVSEVAERRRRLVDRVRAGEYDAADLRGGTFTVSNLGPFGVESFDPVIDPPQVAILGVGAVDERAVREDGGVAFRQELPLSLSFNHRVVDGADAARFLTSIVEAVEAPGE